ncbi:MAG: CRISPR-associated endonuclease Cas2 [Acidobacteria bacterium]|nr:CRISPR-associated endonuclease Cas2 [Acidobacteriota bacterium]
MFVLITYDVSTVDTKGRKRLRRVAKICEDYGQRVQNSVFECTLDTALWVTVRARLQAEIDPASDSLRYYFLGNNWERRVEHVGAKPSYDPDGPMII